MTWKSAEGKVTTNEAWFSTLTVGGPRASVDMPRLLLAAVVLARFMDRKAFQVTAILLVLGAVALLTLRLRPEAVTDELL